MRIVLQRVCSGRVSVQGEVIAEIEEGVILLVGVGPEDLNPRVLEEKLAFLSEKIANLRIFEDDQGKMNRSLLEVGGSAIVVSQFTLFADTRKGRRPSFTDAAPPELARTVVDRFARLLNAQGVPVQSGEFGAHMLVEIHNDGPVTILLER
jgi:D-tyrosyl-tRNA(Tyr) deacylase